MTEEIYEMLLDNLHITFVPDQSTVSRITNEADAGIAYIRKYCDPNATCEPGTESGQLLCEYVLRAESGAGATFDVDFAQEILQMKAARDADLFAEAMGYVKD